MVNLVLQKSPSEIAEGYYYQVSKCNVEEKLEKKAELDQKVGIYSLELFRQIGAAIASGLFIVGAGVVGALASVLAPVVLMITGPATVKVAASHLHEVDEAVRVAEKNVQQSKPEFLQDARKALHIAKLGRGNQWMFLSMGFARIGTGAIMACEALEKLSKLKVVASGFVLKTGVVTAFAALHLVASCVYALRGAVLAYHAQKNLDVINDFADQFQEQKTIADAMQFMETATARGDQYLSLRMNLDYVDLKPNECTTPESKQTYLKQVHVAIAAQKLKQEIFRRSGILMLIGATLSTMALIVGTGGTLGLVLAVGAAVAFATAEVHFILGYNKKSFTKYFERIYQPQPDYPNPIEDSPVEPEREERQTSCPKLPPVLSRVWNCIPWPMSPKFT